MTQHDLANPRDKGTENMPNKPVVELVADLSRALAVSCRNASASFAELTRVLEDAQAESRREEARKVLRKLTALRLTSDGSNP